MAMADPTNASLEPPEQSVHTPKGTVVLPPPVAPETRRLFLTRVLELKPPVRPAPVPLGLVGFGRRGLSPDLVQGLPLTVLVAWFLLMLHQGAQYRHPEHEELGHLVHLAFVLLFVA